MQHYIPKDKIENYFILSDSDLNHISKVLRMKVSDRIYIIFLGNRYLCELVEIKNKLVAKIVSSEPLNNEVPIKVTLIYGLPRLEKFELVLQKAVELGVSKIVPFISERSIVKIDLEKVNDKLARWNRIIKEASEQCHRHELLKVYNPIKLNEINKFLSDLNVVGDENKTNDSTASLFDYLNKKVNSITLLVGPEGGFSQEELAFFNKLGFKGVSLGKRILRTETAAIYLMSVVAFMHERNI